jgi:hypothetical protein
MTRQQPPKGDKPVEFDGEWFRARMRELNVSGRQLAAQLQRDPALVSRSLAGERTFDARDVVGLAQILEVSPEEILVRMGFTVGCFGVPIIGRVLGDGRVSTVTPRKGELVANVKTAREARALVVEADKGDFAPYNGAAFVYTPDPATPVPVTAFGRLCVVECDEEIVPILAVVGRADSRGRSRLTVFATGEEKTAVKVHSAAPIVKIVMA